jgi:hypothetical protein
LEIFPIEHGEFLGGAGRSGVLGGQGSLELRQILVDPQERVLELQDFASLLLAHLIELAEGEIQGAIRPPLKNAQSAQREDSEKIGGLKRVAHFMGI